jgi:hypothetical protein
MGGCLGWMCMGMITGLARITAISRVRMGVRGFAVGTVYQLYLLCSTVLSSSRIYLVEW